MTPMPHTHQTALKPQVASPTSLSRQISIVDAKVLCHATPCELGSPLRKSLAGCFPGIPSRRVNQPLAAATSLLGAVELIIEKRDTAIRHSQLWQPHHMARAWCQAEITVERTLLLVLTLGAISKGTLDSQLAMVS